MNAISPGLARSRGTHWLFDGDTFAQFAFVPATKRPEVPDNLRGTLAFRVSDDAAFLTGQTLTIDG